MKVTALAASLALLTGTAHAESFFQIEGAVGATFAAKVGDGIYYNAGFAHSTPNDAVGFRIGVQANVIDAAPRSFVPGLRMHLVYQNFGRVHWSALAAEDENQAHTMGYNIKTQQCVNGECGDFRQFNSTGGLSTFALTAEPYWDLGHGWSAGIELGPALYRSTWTAEATALSDGKFGPAGTVETIANTPTWQVGALVGASVTYHNFVMRYNYLYAPVSTHGNPAGIRGEHMISIGYKW